MASYSDKGQNASQGAKKFTSSENRQLRFWDSMQTKGINRSAQQRKYAIEKKALSVKYPGCAMALIFSGKSEGLDNYISELADIEADYEGKIMSSIVTDNGSYIYSDEDLEEIERVKKNGY